MLLTFKNKKKNHIKLIIKNFFCIFKTNKKLFIYYSLKKKQKKTAKNF